MGISGINSAPPSAPAPVRDEGELYAPWKMVNLTENGHPKLVTAFGFHSQALDPAYTQELLQQVDAFVRLGKSSLTPYEASRLGQALNENPAPVPAAISNGQVELGDRVSVSSPDYVNGGREVYSGIVDSIDKNGKPWVLVGSDESQQVDGKTTRIESVDAGALEDGRPV